MSAPAPFWTARGDHVLLTVRLTPKAREARIDGAQALADGRQVLAARVPVAPEDGAANAALIRLLARALDVPRSRVSLISGPAQRLKILRIDGPPAALGAALTALGAGSAPARNGV